MGDDRIDKIEHRLGDVERQFKEAFPSGDHIGHCRYHTLMIEQIEEKRKLTQAVKEKTVAGLVWGMLVGIGIAVWQYIKHTMRLP